MTVFDASETARPLWKIGSMYRVKRTPLTRDFGIRCYGGNKADDRACPGEVGTIIEKTWQPNDDQLCKGLWISFSRGRENAVENIDRGDFVEVKDPTK